MKPKFVGHVYTSPDHTTMLAIEDTGTAIRLARLVAGEDRTHDREWVYGSETGLTRAAALMLARDTARQSFNLRQTDEDVTRRLTLCA